MLTYPELAAAQLPLASAAALFAASEAGAWYEPDVPYKILNRRNQFKYSELLSNAAWVVLDAAIVGATKINEVATTAAHYIYQVSTVSAGMATLTLRLRQAERTKAWIYIGTGANATANFDLVAGTVGTVTGTGNPVASITNNGDGSFDCKLTATAVVNAFAGCGPTTTDGVYSYLGTAGSGIYCERAQIEYGAAATAYQKITDWTTEYNAAAAGRITCYQDSAGTIPVTAVEQPVGKWLDKSGRGNHASQATSASRPVLSARKNLLTYSEDFSNAVWTKNILGSATLPVVTANYGTDPLGGSTADRVQLAVAGTTVSDVSWVQNTITSITSASGSIWLKTADGTTKNVTFRVGAVLTIVSVTGTWQRFTTLAAANVARMDVMLYGNNGVPSVDLLVWGAQVEPGATATNYQRINAATDYDAVGFPHYLAADGTDDYMDTAATIAFGVNYYVGTAMTLFTAAQAYPGPFRILRSGGGITTSTDNLLEEYSAVGSPTIKSVTQRYPSLGTLVSAIVCRPGFSLPHVSWNNNPGSLLGRHGVIYPGSTSGDLATSNPALTAGVNATLSLFRGYSGNYMAGRIYGFVYVASRAVNATELASVNNYLMGLSAVTT